MDHRRQATALSSRARARGATYGVFALALLAATGGSASAAATAPAVASARGALGPQNAEDVTIRVENRGGLAPRSIPPAPAATLYADGHLVTTAAAAGSVPAIVPLALRSLSPAATARLVTAAAEARLSDGDYADPPVPDAGITVLTFRHNGTTSRSVFSTLGPRAQDTTEQADRRTRAAAFLAGLQDVERFVGPEGVSAAERLKPERLAISVRPALGGGTAAIKPWPVAAVRLEPLSKAGPCTVLVASQATAVDDGLDGETADTLWRDGRTWRLLLSPLLPDQEGCPR